MVNEFQKHQIEELLRNAHLENEGGVDLIEQYFSVNRSLDRVTEYAHVLLDTEGDLEERKAVLKNLSECIVVKNQRDQHSLWGKVSRCLEKWGISLGKSREIVRAEKLIHRYQSAQFKEKN